MGAKGDTGTAFLQDAMASQERREGKKKNMVGRGVFLFSEAAS